MVEEGLLIALAIIIFLTLLAIVANIIDWLNDLYSQVSGDTEVILRLL